MGNLYVLFLSPLEMYLLSDQPTFFLPMWLGVILLLTDRNENTLPMKLKESLLCFVFFPQETQQIPTEEVALDICLSNGQKVTVNILTSDQTEDVLDVSAAVCSYKVHKPTVFSQYSTKYTTCRDL